MRALLFILLAACGTGDPTPAAPAGAAGPAGPVAPAADVTPAADGASATPVAAPAGGGAAAGAPVAAGPRVVFLGDSLTAGLGLPGDQAYPAVLGRALAEAGLPAQVVNAGVSGDTSAGGLRRVDWVLSQKPDVLVVALGANDMLRGLPPEACAKNLRAIVEKARAAGAEVLLVGMRANPTLGPEYVAVFDAIYPAIAAELGVPLVPFLLDGIAAVPELNQADGIHPTAEGQAKMAALLRPEVERLVRSRAAR